MFNAFIRKRKVKLMRVLLIDQIAKVNYKYTFPLANSLARSGVDITLVIDQKYETENCICDKVNLFNTDEKNVNKIKKFQNYIYSYRNIENMLKKTKYEIIHTQWYTFSPLDYYFLSKFKRKYKLNYVATVHDILPFNKKFYDFYFHKKLYELADSIILQAPDNIHRFAKLFPLSKEKTHMIPHGHMLDYVEEVDMKESRNILGIPKEKIVFLFFGQIKKIKGVDILLDALIKLKDRYPDLYVIIAGSVWKTDFSKYQEIIDNNDLHSCLKTDIRYIPDEEVKYYYCAADALVLPYIDVYQSGVIQLAYAYKKAVISSDLPAFTQFVNEGISGYISKAGDSISLAKAIERAIKDKDRLSEVGVNGYNIVKEKLNWGTIAKKIVDECYMKDACN